MKFSLKNLTLLPQCIACYLTAYYVEGNPYFEVFYVHEKSPFLMYLLEPPVVSYCHRALCGIKLIRKTMNFENQIPHVKLMSTNITWKPVRKPFPKKHYPLSHARFPSSLSITWTKTTDRDTGVNNQQPQFVGLFYPETFSKSLAFK